MRYLRYAFYGTLAVILIVLALANRDAVNLRVLPDELAAFAGWNANISLPLFAVIFGGIVAGLIIGFVGEWFREMKIRNTAAQDRRARSRLEKEVEKLRTPTPGSGDEVLAILDKAPAAR